MEEELVRHTHVKPGHERLNPVRQAIGVVPATVAKVKSALRECDLKQWGNPTIDIGRVTANGQHRGFLALTRRRVGHHR